MDDYESGKRYDFIAANVSGMLAQQNRTPSATLRENIDAQIIGLQKQVAELEATKDRMQKSGILDMRIDDIQRAMRF